MKRSAKLKLNWIALMTISYKEILRFFRIWLQTLLAPVVTLVLYLLIFGKCLGDHLHQMHGYSYLQYLIPGLVLMAIIQNSYVNTATSFFLEKFSNSVEAMLVAPMTAIVLVLGYTFAGVLRAFLVGIIVLAVACLFTAMPLQHPLLVVMVATMTAMVFSVAGLINAIYAKTFDGIAFVPAFLITPLLYLGGVFYSISDLSPFWQKLSLYNPVFNIVNTFRFAVLGVSDINAHFNIYYSGGLMLILLVVLLIWSCLLLNYGVGMKR
jgi:ABC-2 type transport system permease protein